MNIFYANLTATQHKSTFNYENKLYFQHVFNSKQT